MNPISKLSAFFMAAIILSACGGGSTPDSQANIQSQAVNTPTGPTTATVGIILTDAAVDDYKHAYVTITCVELIGGDDGHQVIFSGEKIVDLLALRDSVRILAVSEDVEPGDISKIRLCAKYMRLVQENNDGVGVDIVIDVDLVANGKIDLNLRETITLQAGDVVFASLDWDMNESLKLTETGNERIIMRPVIFVEFDTEPAFKQGLVRVSGIIESVALDDTAFRLCSADTPVQLPENPIIGFLCVDIVLNEKTGLFDPKGQPIMPGDLAPEMPVTVLGLLQRSMDGPMVTPVQNDMGEDLPATTFQILAIVVEGGEPGTWSQLRGTLQTEVDPDPELHTFDFLLDNGQDFDDGTVVTGRFFDMSSRVFRIAAYTGITEITAAELMAMDRAVVDGVIIGSDDPGVADTLHIAIMLARTPGETDLDFIRGRILSVDSITGSLMVATDGTDRCVNTDMDTAIFEFFVNEDSVESVPVTLADLDEGAKVVVSGMEGGCFAAELIIAEGQASVQPL
jgi:hypothetical protein